MSRTPPKSHRPAWRTALLVLLVAMLMALYLHPPQPVFTPESMAKIARAAIAHSASVNGTIQTTIDSVVQQLRTQHPAHVLKDPQWVFNNAGGAMGSMLVLHISLVEYVIIFGTPVGTTGHTGRFMADDWFTMLQGEQWASSPHSFEREVFKAGDQHLLPRGSCKHYLLKPDSWALEYARGNIISMLPFGLADSFTSTFDFVTVWKTVVIAAKGVVTQLLTQMTA